MPVQTRMEANRVEELDAYQDVPQVVQNRTEGSVLERLRDLEGRCASLEKMLSDLAQSCNQRISRLEQEVGL